MINKFLKRHAVLLIFLSAIFLISLLVGVVLYFKSSNETKLYVSENMLNIKNLLLENNINNIFIHLIIILIVVLLSFSILGYISGIIYLFYEGMSIGYTITCLAANYALKGLLFSILYNVFFKIIFLIIYIFILLKLFDIVKGILNYFIFKDNLNIKHYIKKNIISIIILIIIILINDVIIYFFSNFLLKIIINVL